MLRPLTSLVVCVLFAGCYTIINPPPEYQTALQDSSAYYDSSVVVADGGVTIYNQPVYYLNDEYWHDYRYLRPYGWWGYYLWDPYYYNSDWWFYRHRWHRGRYLRYTDPPYAPLPPKKPRREGDYRRPEQAENPPPPAGGDAIHNAALSNPYVAPEYRTEDDGGELQVPADASSSAAIDNPAGGSSPYTADLSEEQFNRPDPELTEAAPSNPTPNADVKPEQPGEPVPHAPEPERKARSVRDQDNRRSAPPANQSPPAEVKQTEVKPAPSPPEKKDNRDQPRQVNTKKVEKEQKKQDKAAAKKDKQKARR